MIDSALGDLAETQTPVLARNRTARLLMLVVFTGGFVAAAIAGLFGALITKAAPIT